MGFRRSSFIQIILVFSTVVMMLLLFLVHTGSGLRCYVCDGEDFLCTVGLLGEKVECPVDTKNCYKSWTVESSPKTKRKCGSKNEVENECKDVLFGANTMLACYCDDHDYCNAANANDVNNNNRFIMTIMTSMMTINLWAFIRA